MNRRLILILVAVLVAALGTTMIFLYVNSLNDRAIAKTAPARVLVAKTPIAAGTTAAAAAAAGAFQLQTVPALAIAPGALADINGIRDKVALSTIFPGEQILAAKFGASAEAAASASSGLPLAPGDLAVSVQMTDTGRVAGFVQPGSTVAVFLTSAAGGNGGAAGPRTRVLLPKAEVIAVGPTTVTPTTATNANKEALPRAILTFSLPQADAEKLIFASQNGTLYFGLLNEKSKVTPDAGVGNNNLFG